MRPKYQGRGRMVGDSAGCEWRPIRMAVLECIRSEVVELVGVRLLITLVVKTTQVVT